MNNLLLLIILGIIGYVLKKYIDAKTRKTNVSFSIKFQYQNLTNHPFVKYELIPHLKKHFCRQEVIDKELISLKKEYNNLGKVPQTKTSKEKSNEELEDIFWTRLLAKKISDSTIKYGKSCNLGFTVLNFDSDNQITWDNQFKSFINSDPEFYLTIFNDDKMIFGNSVEIRGKNLIKKRADRYQKYLKIYFYIHRPSGERTREKIGDICEFPYNFFRLYSVGEVSKLERIKQSLLEEFNLKEIEKRDGDFYQDELGETELVDELGFIVGNDYVHITII